jgi:hypothetical protein
MVLLLGVAPAFANSQAGTWTISYFFAGTGCTGPAYTPTHQDGGGFGTGAQAQDPVVQAGGSLDVFITVTGGAANTNFFYEVDSIFGPVPLFTTDGSGDASACLSSVSIPGSTLTSGTQCITVPEKIAAGDNSQGAFDGNIIDHIWTGAPGSICNQFQFGPVPEFPIGALVVIGLLFPAILLVRKRTLTVSQ